MWRNVLQRARLVDARTRLPRPRQGSVAYKEATEVARRIAHARLQYFNGHYGLVYHKVFIRNQKTRWGACSSKSNLGFNLCIAYLPEHLADYVIVHELCHLGQFNHSRMFWDLVAETIPDHKERRKELRSVYRF